MKGRELFLSKPDFPPEPDHRVTLDHVLGYEVDCEPTAVRGGTRRLRMPSGRFDDARFAVNAWVHRLQVKVSS